VPWRRERRRSGRENFPPPRRWTACIPYDKLTA